ncbi:hypothetical protein ACHQM5_024313 [Ranunculus cassubicifolius]
MSTLNPNSCYYQVFGISDLNDENSRIRFIKFSRREEVRTMSEFKASIVTDYSTNVYTFLAGIIAMLAAPLRCLDYNCFIFFLVSFIVYATIGFLHSLLNIIITTSVLVFNKEDTAKELGVGENAHNPDELEPDVANGVFTSHGYYGPIALFYTYLVGITAAIALLIFVCLKKKTCTNTREVFVQKVD